MSDNIPFDIQSEIMKRLPVKSLIQFRSVSKQWKSLIDSPKFIKNYHINHANPQHHLLVRYKSDSVPAYTSIIDNSTFPQQKFPLTAPESLSLLRKTSALSSVDGLLCFYGDVDSRNDMAIIWNPSVRKSVGIVIPLPKAGHNVFGFGVCPDTSHPKLVKISVHATPSMWEVEVFTLSDSLGLLEYFDEGEVSVCGVWTRKDGANKPFTKIYTVKVMVEGKELYEVLGFRNNGEVVVKLDDLESTIEVYEPSSRHIYGVGINGEQRAYFIARSYIEGLSS